MPPVDLVDAAMVALILIGGILCSFGYHVFKLVLALVGLGLGGAFGLFVGTGSFGDGPMVLLATVLGAAVGAWMTLALHFIGVFLLGAILGTGATTLAGAPPEPLILALTALVGGILALTLQRFTITLTTALFGAWGIVIGITHLALDTVEATAFPQALLPTAGGMQSTFWWWLGLAILGIFVQYRWPRKPEVRRARATPA